MPRPATARNIRRRWSRTWSVMPSPRRCRRAGCRRKPSDFLVNPTGNFVVGGPDGDCGLTGRKIIVDTYGGYAPHGGGAFLRQGPDQGRSLGRLCSALPRQERRCCRARGALHHSDRICHRRGRPNVLAGRYPRQRPSRRAETREGITADFRLTPTNIRRTLKLNRPIYRRTAAYGHFGRAPEKDGGFSWEKTDLVKELRSAVG